MPPIPDPKSDPDERPRPDPVPVACPVCQAMIPADVVGDGGVRDCPSCGAAVNIPDPWSGAGAEPVSREVVERTRALKSRTVLPGKKSEDTRMSRGRPEPRPWQLEDEDEDEIDQEGEGDGERLGGDDDDEESLDGAPEAGADGAGSPEEGEGGGGESQDGDGDGDEVDDGEAEPDEPADPGRHRFNPDKQATMISLEDVAATAKDDEDFEWRMSGLDRATEKEIESKSWTGRRFLVVGLLIGGLLAGAIWFVGLKTRVFEAGPRTEAPPDEITIKLEVLETLEQRLRDFLAEDTIDGMLEYVRSPDITRNHMTEYFDRPGAVRDLEIVNVNAGIDLIEKGEFEFMGIVVELSDLSFRGAIFEDSEDGWLLDWESFVGYGDMAWETFFAEKPDYPVRMRVIFQPDDYFNYSYGSPEDYACFKIYDPESRIAHWAYCEAGSEIHRQMNETVFYSRENGNNLAEAVLLLTFKPEGREHDQVWIEEFLERGHLVP